MKSKPFAFACKLPRQESARLRRADYATVATWELDRNAPKRPTLERVQDVMKGRIGSTNLSAAEKALLERIMKEGSFKTRQDFFSSALLSLITKGILLFPIICSVLHILRRPPTGQLQRWQAPPKPASPWWQVFSEAVGYSAHRAVRRPVLSGRRIGTRPAGSHGPCHGRKGMGSGGKIVADELVM